MGSTISSIPIIGQSPIGLIIGAIAGGNSSSPTTTTPNVTLGKPLNAEPAIFVPGPQVSRNDSTVVTNPMPITSPNKTNTSSTKPEDTSNIILIAGGIMVLILLLR